MKALSDPIERIYSLGAEPLSRCLQAIELRLREVAAVSKDAAATIAAGGKRLRPLLVCITAWPAGDPDLALVRSAVAVELIHAATLVHDDVLDDAPLRRGRPTVFAAAGRGAATATGDVLLSRAFAELQRNGSQPALERLSAASSALAQGELRQREDAWRSDITIERYLSRCELKTARLFEVACELGALTTGADAAVVNALGAFGREIGLAFQILDDVLDVTGPSERTGKRRGGDLLDGTATLPLILARERESELASLELRGLADTEAEAVCDLIVRSGATDAARARAVDLTEQALGRLPAGLDGAQREALGLVADGVVDRYG